MGMLLLDSWQAACRLGGSRRLLTRALRRMGRGRAEETLRASEARFRALTEQGSDLVTIVDAAGVIRYASPSHQRMLGYPPAELTGRHVLTLVHPDDLPRTSEAMARRGTRDDGPGRGARPKRRRRLAGARDRG